MWCSTCHARGDERERAQRLVAEDERQPLADLRAHRLPRDARRRHVVAARAAGAASAPTRETPTASIAIANGAVSSWISPPAMPGPISADDVSPSVIFAFASTSRSRPAICAISTWYAAPPTTFCTPQKKPTAYSTSIDSTPRHAQSGIASSATPRLTSDAMTIGSLRTRSSITPACSETSANGSVSSATRMPICSGVACSSSAAVSGSARFVICAPNDVIVSDSHSRRKSASAPQAAEVAAGECVRAARTVSWCFSGRDERARPPMTHRRKLRRAEGFSRWSDSAVPGGHPRGRYYRSAGRRDRCRRRAHAAIAMRAATRQRLRRATARSRWKWTGSSWRSMRKVRSMMKRFYAAARCARQCE